MMAAQPAKTWRERIEAARKAEREGRPRSFGDTDHTDATGWSTCAIGERFAHDEKTREAIMDEWGMALKPYKGVAKSRFPHLRARALAKGDRIRTLALLGMAFMQAVHDDEPRQAARIQRAIEREAGGA